MTYLAGGDVALSVSMTLCSTLLGVVLTPWLIALYAGAAVEVDVQTVMLSMVQIVASHWRGFCATSLFLH